VSTTDYTVRGMTCEHCAGSVTAEITKIRGVTGVQVDVAAGRVTVQADQPVAVDAIAEAVEEAGYEVVPA
jgi:copper ion binding protein